MTLRHYSVKRDKTAGWLELNISDGGSAPWRGVRLDSGLIGFQELAARAAKAAVNNGARLDQPSIANLTAIGISVASPAQTHVGQQPLPRHKAQ